nr:MAG: hypothetical protein DIU78_10730 [Pseudomonadota bacterium]
MAISTRLLAACGALALAGMGCASQPAAPFDTLKTSNLTAFRLQNYEPPEAAAATPTAPGQIPGLPPEIQQWIQQGAQGLQALIPPGLLPGFPPAAAPAQPTSTVPRFHGFRILGQTQVMDPELKEQLGEILGEPDSFDNAHARCAPGVIYAEMGLTFTQGPGAPSNDVLISFSCSQVVSRSFSWPHPATGMTPDTVKALSEVVQKLWPQGA